jgi:plastocyanin
MRRLSLLAVLAPLALALAACTGTPGPGWTYAAPTVPPASQAAPSGAASAAPSGSASGAPSDAGSGAVQVSASNVNYEQAQITAPAGVAFVIHFNNKDAGIPHNVAIKDASGTEVFKGDIVTGPAEVDYKVPALTAGSYTFTCTVHPNMTGMLMVGG